MQVLVSSIAVCVLVLGIYFSHKTEEKTDVFSFDSDKKQTLSLEADDVEKNKVEDNNLPTVIPTPTSVPIATPTFLADKTTTLFDYRYPNSEVISSSTTSLVLESKDDPNVITNWYKEKIRAVGFKARSFASTKANDNVLNKLVGEDSERKISVNIEKEPSQSDVRISVLLTLN